MATNTPYAQLTGTVTFYIAPSGEAEPTVNATPSGNWVELGCTEGDQVAPESTGGLTYFYDNCHQGPVKAVRPQEDVMIRFNLVDLTLEKLARVTHNVSRLTNQSGPPATRRYPLRKGFNPSEYALLAKGSADSPYGNFPGQTYIPRGVFEGEFTMTRSKTGRAAVACVFHALEDDTESSGDQLGWSTVQTS